MQGFRQDYKSSRKAGPQWKCISISASAGEALHVTACFDLASVSPYSASKPARFPRHVLRTYSSVSLCTFHLPLFIRTNEKIEPIPQPMGMDHQMALEPMKWASR